MGSLLSLKVVIFAFAEKAVVAVNHVGNPRRGAAPLRQVFAEHVLERLMERIEPNEVEPPVSVTGVINPV